MTTNSSPDDPRAAFQLDLHALLVEAQAAAKAFQDAEEIVAKEMAETEKRETGLLKGGDFARLKLKLPELAASINAAGKAGKAQLELRKAAGASLSTAVSALKTEVVKAGMRLGPVKPI
jgi:hypothetical protein